MRLQNLQVWKLPENTKILIGEVESVDISEEFAHGKIITGTWNVSCEDI